MVSGRIDGQDEATTKNDGCDSIFGSNACAPDFCACGRQWLAALDSLTWAAGWTSDAFDQLLSVTTAALQQGVLVSGGARSEFGLALARQSGRDYPGGCCFLLHDVRSFTANVVAAMSEGVISADAVYIAAAVEHGTGRASTAALGASAVRWDEPFTGDPTKDVRWFAAPMGSRLFQTGAAAFRESAERFAKAWPVASCHPGPAVGATGWLTAADDSSDGGLGPVSSPVPVNGLADYEYAFGPCVAATLAPMTVRSWCGSVFDTHECGNSGWQRAMSPSTHPVVWATVEVWFAEGTRIQCLGVAFACNKGRRRRF